MSQDDLTIRVRELESAIATQRVHESTIEILRNQLYDSQQKVETSVEELATVIWFLILKLTNKLEETFNLVWKACQKTQLLLEENENLHSQMSTLRSETTATESKLRADLDNALDQLNKEQTLHTETSSLFENTRDSLERTEELLKNVKFELAKVNELLIILRIY